MERLEARLLLDGGAIAQGADSFPTADAGVDQEVIDTDGDGCACVRLRGSAGGGAIASYRWSENGAELAWGAEASIDVDLAVGRHRVTLTVIDAAGAMGVDETVVDVLPPPAAGGPAAPANPAAPTAHRLDHDYRILWTGGEGPLALRAFGPTGWQLVAGAVPAAQGHCDWHAAASGCGWYLFAARAGAGGADWSVSPSWLKVVEPSVVLYDGAAGTLPAAQGWLYGTDPLFGASASQALTPAGTLLDTTAAAGESAGYFSEDFLAGAIRHPRMVPLDRGAGYAVRFTARVAAESHAGGDRAGFSAIVLSADGRGVELGFWADEVWAQSGSGFTHAEGAAFDTTAALTHYELRVLGDSYTLWAGGSTVLSGPLRDYSAHPHPVYSRTSFLFFGDDTGSASAEVELADISIAGW